MADSNETPNRPHPATNHLETTSERGIPQAPIDLGAAPSLRMDEVLLRTMFELQKETMISLIEAVKSPVSSHHITLPEFDPDKTDADARAWCNTVDLCLSEKPLTGSALMIAISGALKSSASRWWAQASFPGIQWTEFRELFTARYDCMETPAATLISLQNSRPNQNECLSAYASRLITMLASKWQNTEQIAVSTVLSHLTQFDGRLQRLAFTTEIISRDKLQRELKAFSFMKRKAPMQSLANEESADHKRFKTPTILKCYHCGKQGHMSSECRYAIDNSIPGRASSLSPRPPQSTIICFNCGNTGHYASRCPNGPTSSGAGANSGGAVAGLRASNVGGGGGVSMAGNTREHRVNLCCVNNLNNG